MLTFDKLGRLPGIRWLIMRDNFKFILLICAVMLLLGCADPILEHLKQGDAYYGDGRWDDAI